jgi:hypothetical protein
MTSLASRAARLVQTMGLPVFPVFETKIPAVPHGYKDAVRDPNEAYRLFCRYPNAALIGVPCGTISNLAVIDIDPDGMHWFQQRYHRFPPTRVHTTRRNGRHLFYRLPVPNDPLFKCSVGKLSHGVDTRGEGGSIIWWPATGGRVINDVEMVSCPRWVLRALYREKRFPSGEGDEARRDARGIDGLLRFVAHAREGERNSKLFWAALKAGAAIERGLIGMNDAMAQLMNASTLPQYESRLAIKSGIMRGRGIR